MAYAVAVGWPLDEQHLRRAFLLVSGTICRKSRDPGYAYAEALSRNPQRVGERLEKAIAELEARP